jgi:nucleoside-diphosphate-sugar epimerase
MNNIAVTGSSGFIGRHLINTLISNNVNVIELDIDKGFNLLKEEDIKHVPEFDVIIHLAAKSFVPLSLKNPKEFYYHNFNITLNVLELARKNNAKVILFSSYLYGEPEYLPIDEKHPLKPHNPYGHSKLICEKLCKGYKNDFNVPIIIFRPFNIYGPGQNINFLIPSIIEQLKTGEITLKDPRPKRDFICVDDVVKAVLLAIAFDKSDYEIFNLGYGKSNSVVDIVNIICELSAKMPKISFTNEIRQGEILDTVADISKINSLLKWKPEIDLKSGIKMILEYS